MSVPTMGLHEADPRQLGGYRLLGRLRESRLGVVYLGRDGAGNQVSVAMLNDAGGIDESTRRRFAQQVEGDSEVVAARTSGRSALWVACPYAQDGGGPDAGVFLERAGRGGPVVRDGPMVMPHWAGERGVSAVRWSARWGGADSKVARGEANWWLIGALGLLLVLLLALIFALYLWLLQFPPPQPPEMGGQPEQSQESEPGEGEEDTPTVPTVPGPGPGSEGDQEWGESPEDNL